MTSLNQIISILSERVGQPFNTALQDELKVIVNYKVANYFKQLLEKNPAQRKFFTKEIVVNLDKVDQSICPIDTIDCYFLKSIQKVPTPIRGNYALFDYVGTLDKQTAFGHSTPEYLYFIKYNKYTANLSRYYYSDQYIYILNDLNTPKIMVRGIWSDPRALQGFLCADGSTCYTDDDNYPIPKDILQAIIRDTLSVELRNIFPEQNEVKVDEQGT